jgi:hypothetical protein
MKKNLSYATMLLSTAVLATGCESNTVNGYFSPLSNPASTSTTSSITAPGSTTPSGTPSGSSSPTSTPTPTGTATTTPPPPPPPASPTPTQTIPVPLPSNTQTIGPVSTPTPTVTPTPTKTATPAPSPSASGPVVCNPMGGSGGGTETSGLVGSLSYLPSSIIGSLGDVNLADFATDGVVVTNSVFFSQINVPSQSFTDGFPGENGKPLTDKNGNTLNQYFSLNFNGEIVLGPNEAPGNYQFLTLSDDGSIFSVDPGTGVMTQLINRDEEHATTVGCSSTTVAMKPGVPVKMNLQYFQGPPVTIAMVLMWRLVPAGESLNPPECTNNSSNPGGDGYYFNESVTPSAPLAPYQAILNDGWHVLGPQNFVLPSTTPVNPCVTPSPSPTATTPVPLPSNTQTIAPVSSPSPTATIAPSPSPTPSAPCTETCYLDNGVGVTSGGPGSVCVLTQCNPGYVADNGACVPVVSVTAFKCTSYEQLILNSSNELTTATGSEIPAQDLSGSGVCYYYPIVELNTPLSGASYLTGTAVSDHDQDVVSRDHDVNTGNPLYAWHPYTMKHFNADLTIAGPRQLHVTGGSVSGANFTTGTVNIDNFFLIGAYPSSASLAPANLASYYSAWGTADSVVVGGANNSLSGIAFNPAGLPIKTDGTNSYPDGSTGSYSDNGIVSSSSYAVIPLTSAWMGTEWPGGTASVPEVPLTNLITPNVSTTVDFRALDAGASRSLNNVYLLVQ